MNSAQRSELLLYRNVADRVQGMIEDGTLRPGDRIPSVRRLHRPHRIPMPKQRECYRRAWLSTGRADSAANTPGL